MSLSLKLEVVYEDNHLLIVNKPAMLPTMGVAEGENSLVTLAKQYLKQKYQKPGNVYLGVVSRLDSWVSGVIVLARTSKSAARLNAQFAKSSVKKVYWAIVAGEAPQNGELENWVLKNDSRRRMFCVDRNQTGAKQARLRFECIESRSDCSLVEIELLTGRKHQIRVQMAEAGMSILGDRKYGSTKPFTKGIALHSRCLELTHPTQKTELRFDVPPPSYWDLHQF